MFKHILVEKVYQGHVGCDYGIYDTLLVSYSRYDEFRRLMLEKAPDERSKVIASVVVGHFDVYYADSVGRVTKYAIEGD